MTKANLMLPQDQQFMDESRRVCDELKSSGTSSGFNLSGMRYVAEKYFDKNIRVDFSDGTSVVEFIKWLYLKYDEYLADNTKILQPGQKVIGGMF